MATLKQLRRRIRSVESTQQITKAMEMVAAAKLKRAQDRVVTARPYAACIQAMLQNLAAAAESLSHPLFDQRPVKKRAVLVIASDKGLCGSYNMNVFRMVERAFTGDAREDVVLVPVGRRACQYFARRHWNIPHSLPEFGDQADLMNARSLSSELARMFTSGEVDQIDLLSTRFISTASRQVSISVLLPIAPSEKEGTVRRTDYIFEPSPQGIFGTLLPRYLENRIYQAMAESAASEHSSRMVSMGAATKNAADVISNLTLVRNRLRQAAITREISEIVGGADALK